MGNELEKKRSTFFLVGGTKGNLSVFDTCPIRLFVWITQTLFQKSGI